MFLTPAVPRSNNENTNVIAKKTPAQVAPRRAFGDIPVNVKNAATPSFSKQNAHRVLKKPTPVKSEKPRCAVPQFFIRPDDEDTLDFIDIPSFNEPEDDYSDIRPVREMENNIKNLMFSYRDLKTPPLPNQDDWSDKLDLFLENPESSYEDVMSQSPPKIRGTFKEVSLPEIDVSF